METLLPSLEAIVVGSVALTARALADAGAELTLVQWRVLVVLHGAAEPLAIGDLARRVGASPSAMSRLIGRLTARGYLSSHGDRRDRRERRVVLSQRGRQLVGRIVSVRDRQLAALAVDADDTGAVERLGLAFAGIADGLDEEGRTA
jgi:DNA-binding MarR family transcriptional regulator